MPSLKSIRKRITSTKSTQKITKAMKMVAGARLTRAQQRIVAMRPYAIKTQEVLHTVAASVHAGAEVEGEGLHPLLARRPESRALLLVLSSDRGLCGAFNTNIQKATLRALAEKKEANVTVSFATVGRKGREFLQRNQKEILRDFTGIYEALDLARAREVSQYLVPLFQSGEVDSIYIVYNEFKSAITQKVVVEKLLPVEPPEGAGDANAELIFEPNRAALLERIVPMYVEVSVFRALLESQASEYGARMSAMDSATRNAKEMIDRLTLQYNRARQAAITKELMEIIGGAEALKD